MSKRNLDRRGFLKGSVVVSAGAAVVLSLEEKTLLAKTSQKSGESARPGADLPTGLVGKVKISRLICGGNLINGYAHSRDLTYVSSLMEHYFTDEKVLETFELCERNGINTMVGNHRQGENTMRVLQKHWKNGGKIQWLAQVNPRLADIKTNIKEAIDGGAAGAFLQGGIADGWSTSHPDKIGEVVSFIQENGLIAGVGGHQNRVPMVCEEKGFKPDFYFKTINAVDYHCSQPEEVIAFMKRSATPWIAYKVLGAGVVNPTKGFKYAIQSGADFLCVGMFDFQVKDDVTILNSLLARNLQRARPWRA